MAKHGKTFHGMLLDFICFTPLPLSSQHPLQWLAKSCYCASCKNQQQEPPLTIVIVPTDAETQKTENYVVLVVAVIVSE